MIYYYSFQSGKSINIILIKFIHRIDSTLIFCNTLGRPKTVLIQMKQKAINRADIPPPRRYRREIIEKIINKYLWQATWGATRSTRIPFLSTPLAVRIWSLRYTESGLLQMQNFPFIFKILYPNVAGRELIYSEGAAKESRRGASYLERGNSGLGKGWGLRNWQVPVKNYN